MSRVVAAVLALLLSGCDEGSELEVPGTTVRVMFVDLTSSIGDEAAEASVEKAATIVRATSNDTQLIVLPVDRSPNATPVLNYYVGVGARPSEGREIDDELIAKADDVAVALRESRKLYDAAETRQEPISCLVRTFATAAQVFALHRSEGAKYQLIYLSDMVEECDDLPCGGELCGKMQLTREGFAEAMTTLARYEPGFSLDFAELFVVTATDTVAAEQHYVPMEQRRLFWDEVFRKLKVSNEQIAGAGFLPMIPSRLATASQ